MKIEISVSQLSDIVRPAFAYRKLFNDIHTVQIWRAQVSWRVRTWKSIKINIDDIATLDFTVATERKR